MNNRLDRHMKLPFSLCDNTSYLGLMGTVYLFMDLATENGDDMGMGRKDLDPKGLFWVATKTKVIFERKPKLLEEVTVSTWPGAPERIRTNRYYCITKGDEMLVRGKTEWAIIDKTEGKLHRINEVSPAEFEYINENCCEEPFAKVKADFDEAELLGEYTVPSTDIDTSQHMNNVAYIRGALDMFTVKRIEEMNIREIDIIYRTQCYEGENLTFKCRKKDETIEIGVVKQDGNTAAIMRLVCD